MTLHIKRLLGPKSLAFLAFFYTVFLTWISVSERGNLPYIPNFPLQDKLAHLIAYTILGLLWGLYWIRSTNPRAWHPYFTVLLGAALIYGTVIEVIQEQLTASRSADPFDVLANLFGMLIGAILGQYFYKQLLSNK